MSAEDWGNLTDQTPPESRVKTRYAYNPHTNCTTTKPRLIQAGFRRCGRGGAERTSRRRTHSLQAVQPDGFSSGNPFSSVVSVPAPVRGFSPTTATSSSGAPPSVIVPVGSLS